MQSAEELVKGIPALEEAWHRISKRKSHKEQAIEYVLSIFPQANASELYGLYGDFLWARDYEGCEQTCAGVKHCPTHGMKPTVCMEEMHGRIIYVVQLLRCGSSSQIKRQKELERQIAASRLPATFHEKTFNNFDTNNIEKSIVDAKGAAMCCLQDCSSLVLAGTRGTGKTHLAAAMVNEQLASGKVALFVSAPELWDDLRESTNSGKGFETMGAVKSVDFLVIDDLGIERGTDWVGERLYMIIDKRYKEKLQTVITTNAMTPSELAELLGERGDRIVSRLREMGRWCTIRGKDYRGRRRQAVMYDSQ